MIAELSLSDLQQRGYREDEESRRTFERRYRGITTLAIALVLGGAYLSATQRSVAGYWLFLSGLAGCLGAAFHAARATPLSRISGHRMQRFRRSDSAGKRTEFIYVDDETHTYFVRLISRSSPW